MLPLFVAFPLRIRAREGTQNLEKGVEHAPPKDCKHHLLLSNQYKSIHSSPPPTLHQEDVLCVLDR